MHQEPTQRRPTAPERPQREVPPLRFTRKELESRNINENAVIIIDNVVYDISDFLLDHPGGMNVLMDTAGRDASECFHEVRHSELAVDWRNEFAIGEVVDADRWEIKLRPVTPEPDPPEWYCVWLDRIRGLTMPAFIGLIILYTLRYFFGIEPPE